MVFKNGLSFVTSLNYSASVAKILNNLTFLYNPAWQYGKGKEPNLPIAFFFVKDCKEVGETQLNTKTVMFYNSQSNTDSKTRQGALLDVIADNSINMPKEYQLDVLIPFENSQYFEQYQLNEESLTGVASFLANINRQEEIARDIQSVLAPGANALTPSFSSLSTILSTTVQLLKILFSALSIDMSNVANFANFVLQQNDINKVSLDYMRDARRILKMKWWNGWKFKYVMIKNLDIDKKGTDSNFYEGRLTLIEVPVMTVLREDQLELGNTYTTVGEGLCKFLDKWFSTAKEGQ